MSDRPKYIGESIDTGAAQLAQAAFVQLESVMVTAPSPDHRVAAERYVATMLNIELAREVAVNALKEHHETAKAKAEAAEAYRRQDHAEVVVQDEPREAVAA